MNNITYGEIILHYLKKDYMDKSNVLNNISLEIFEGEFVAILGANGGGKSTFIKLLLGIYESSSGHIKLLNKNQIGYVPQNVTNIDIIFPATVDEIIKTAFAYRNSFFKKISIPDSFLMFKTHLRICIDKYQVLYNETKCLNFHILETLKNVLKMLKRFSIIYFRFNRI